MIHDLTATPWPDLLPAILATAQAHFTGLTDKEPMREIYRRSDRTYRGLIADVMGVGR